MRPDSDELADHRDGQKSSFSHRGGLWLKIVVVRMQSDIKKVHSPVEKIFSLQSSSDLVALKVPLLEQFVDDSEWSGVVVFMSAEPFEHFDTLITSSYRMAPLWL